MASAKPKKATVADKNKGAKLSQSDYVDLLADLREIDIKLYAVRGPDMKGDELGKWFQLSGDVTQAIDYLERETLASINNMLGKDAVQMANAIDEIEKRLHGLTKRATIIRIVGEVADTIGMIASLV